MSRAEETRLLEKALRDPAELRKKLVLAIALAPPKARTARPKAGPKGIRRS